MEFENIKNDIKQILSEKRYNHPLGVVKRAEQLAQIYNQDIQKARLVAIAHDIAKEINKEDAYQYVKQHNIIIDEIEKNEPSLLHSKIGANICKEKYNFTDDMTQAILYHTTGNINMNTFDKIIFLADKTEEGRKNEIDLDEANKIVDKDINEGMLYMIRNSLEYTLKKKKLIHPDTIILMNKLILESIQNKK